MPESKFLVGPAGDPVSTAGEVTMLGDLAEAELFVISLCASQAARWGTDVEPEAAALVAACLTRHEHESDTRKLGLYAEGVSRLSLRGVISDFGDTGNGKSSIAVHWDRLGMGRHTIRSAPSRKRGNA